MELTVQNPWFDALASGTKNVEGRLDKPKYGNLDKGDTIIFKLEGGDATVERTVKTVHSYSSFAHLLNREKIANVLPGVETVEEGASIYHKFFKPEHEELYGALAIVLNPLEKPEPEANQEPSDESPEEENADSEKNEESE